MYIRPIKAIGGFLPMDKDGFIINETSFDKIPQHWLPVLEKVVHSYQSNLKDQLHSIYLRGSLARGKSVDRFSDADFFALVHLPKFRWKDADWQFELEKRLQHEFEFVREIEIKLTSYSDDYISFNPLMSMVLKTQSLFLFGDDLRVTLPKFKPSKAMMLNFKWLERDVNRFLTKEKIAFQDCQEIMKILIRTGFELVMERVGKYTPDLYWCYDSFVNYYPEMADKMKEALYFHLNPIKDKKTLDPLVNTLTVYLIKELKRSGIN